MGGGGGARFPSEHKFIKFHASFRKFSAKNIGMKGLAPTPSENPRSATGTSPHQVLLY